jgi:hypothetical protein
LVIDLESGGSASGAFENDLQLRHS